MSLRMLLWLAIALLLALAAWQFLRALAAARGGSRAGGADARRARPATVDDEGDGEDDDEGDFDYAPVLRHDAGNAAAATTTAAAAPAADSFQLELENRHLRTQLAALQALSERQQDEIRQLQGRLDSATAAAEQTSTSPEYSEALVLAEQGLGADVIAARCGISVAEAELLTSLAGGRGAGR